LRVGVYQLAFLGTPAHAAVSATVAEIGGSGRGMVNAILRRVAQLVASGPVAWPDRATELSYPGWLVDRLVDDLGAGPAFGALEAMNRSLPVTVRADGYAQDRASQLVAAHVGAVAGERVADVCAAPGGKATAMASSGAWVLAGDVEPGRAGLVRVNADRLRPPGPARAPAGTVAVMAADGRHPPLRPGTFDRVLVDAPCSGLGTLRRRPDARWRIQPEDIDRLAKLQRELLGAALPLVRPGGVVAYSVCTLTEAETIAVDRWLAACHPDWHPLAPPGPPWQPVGRGARLLPQEAGTDGMFLLTVRPPAQAD
jgi:16S rRNA (cytosine967-C5)-methyltransferase